MRGGGSGVHLLWECGECPRCAGGWAVRGGGGFRMGQESLQSAR